MKKFLVTLACVLALLLLLAGAAGPVTAGDTPPANEGLAPEAVNAEDVQNYFPVQGKLTDAAGHPLTGDYEIKFRLYDVYTGGTALCLDTNLVKVTNGLFNTEVWGNCQDKILGQQLYLSIEVEDNGEMDPRQPIFAVPYAWSLRPGATMIGTVGPDPMLHIENADPSGRGLRVYAMSPTGTNYGIVGAAVSPNGYGGYFYNNATGGTGLWATGNAGTAIKAESTAGTALNASGSTGVEANSPSGVAIKATGTGVIQSSAISYVWISGNGARPYRQSDSTVIDMDSVGGAKIRGMAVGDKNVVLPITITSPLYGQNVRVTGLDIEYLTDTTFEGITAVLLRRQIAGCDAASCYANLVNDGTNLSCEDLTTSTSCSHHYNITANNVLTANSGILYLTIQLTFVDNIGWIRIGGVRLTLEHD